MVEGNFDEELKVLIVPLNVFLSGDACLPVTALRVLEIGNSKLILEGRGTYTRLIDDTNGAVVAQVKTFKRSNVHAFIVLSHSQHGSNRTDTQFLVYGGESLRILDLQFSTNVDVDTSLQPASAEFLAPDWILAGCTSSTDDEAQSAYLITAHNAILGLRVEDGSADHSKTIKLRQLVAGVKSILYNADVIALSAFHVLIAAGTAFGEIIVWSCFSDEHSANAKGSIHHFFTGHHGSIYGVRISPPIQTLPGRPSGRLLASCSDDRTVRMWDISDCEHTSRDDPSAYSTDGFELRCTGFGEEPGDKEVLGSQSWLVSAFGHKSRIWDVYFLPLGEKQNQMCLITRGEDATCVVWSLSWGSSTSGSTFELKEVSTVHHHSGKNIWSLDMRTTDSGATVYSGGADGALKTFNIEIAGNAEVVLPNKTDFVSTSINIESPEVEKDSSTKFFAFVTPDCFLIITLRGEIQIGWLGSQDERRHIFKQALYTEEDLRPFAAISSLTQYGIALLGNSKGMIRLYRHETKTMHSLIDIGKRPQRLFFLNYENNESSSSETITFVASYLTHEEADFFTVKMRQNGDTQVDKTTMILPSLFEVTCASLVCEDNSLALGSWRGGLAIYHPKSAESSVSAVCSRKIHNKEGMTQIATLRSLYGKSEAPINCILTCGRQGNYCVHELKSDPRSHETVSIRTIHRSIPEIDIVIEGAYVSPAAEDLMLYGFRGVDFVIWNESKQTEVARADCGGAHRSWAFHPNQKSGSDAILLWVKKSHMRALEVHGEKFRSLCAGGQGREINSMSVSQSPGRDALIATGSEDTNLRIFAAVETQKQALWGAFKCVRVLRKADTGVQHVAWSRCGNYLFSSAGKEEFSVWRFCQIPTFGHASVLEASCPKDDPNSDLRVTGFDVLEMDSQDGNFLLCLTYSNSTIKILHYTSTTDSDNFTLLARGTYTSNCLTQACFVLRGSSLLLITASTDGFMTFWNLTPILEKLYTLSSSIKLKQPIHRTSVTPDTISCETRYQGHLNCVKSIEVAQISEATSLVITGGDDNALCLLLLSTDFESSEDSESALSQVRIPDAHAACISATKIIEQKTSTDGDTKIVEIMFSSTGIDNRVKVWLVTVDEKNPGPERIQTRNLVDRYIPVMDISSMDVIGDEENKKLLVCGVGMEMLRLRER